MNKKRPFIDFFFDSLGDWIDDCDLGFRYCSMCSYSELREESIREARLSPSWSAHPDKQWFDCKLFGLERVWGQGDKRCQNKMIELRAGMKKEYTEMLNILEEKK